MRGLFAVLRTELYRILTTRPALAALVIGPLIYALYYPQPYRNEALRDVPIALVDLDGTDSSRQFARRLDASSDVAIAAVLPDEKSAEREVYARDLYGMLVIPQHFERDVLHGRQSPVALYGDASYFLVYQRISGAVAAVARAFGAEVESARLIAMGVDPAIAAAASDPMPLTAVALFNPQGGYATYILPAALVLILQQTMLMGIGLLGAIEDDRTSSDPMAASAGPVSLVLGKMLAYLTVEAVIFPFYLIVLPYLYDIPRLGSFETIAIFSIPFVLSASALGLIIARLFRRPVVVQLVGAALGLPFIFLAGFTWPIEAVPEPLRTIALVLPSSTAIAGIVEVSQLGASLSDVGHAFLTLWVLAVVYALVAMQLEKFHLRSAAAAP
ncbi:ABC transporter permease [Rhizobium sp. S152]|uniref:ABC transporter permease n=1 Tax=Rhizobium sp. S152 TaxID=3055038 RepID=UPI0025A99A8D|nr:ABC transporter permease [Rhizobium sp. S152]MDM9627795.1 ABC transporter permease [Rhizobium sp. S152]